MHAIGPVPFAGMQLLQMGASVTRVSPPVERAIGIELSAHADVLNLGKTPLVINLKEASGQAELHSLLADADVLTASMQRERDTT